MTEITTVEEREALAGILYPYVNVLRGEDWEQALEVADAALRWFAARQPAPTVSADMVRTLQYGHIGDDGEHLGMCILVGDLPYLGIEVRDV